MRAFLFGLALSTLIAAPALACSSTVKSVAPPRSYTAEIDAHLANAKLSEADLAKVRDLRAKIETLEAEKHIGEAYKTETEAMGILGYRRVLSRCAPSTWQKLDKIS